MAAKKTPAVSEEFTKTREYIRRYVVLPDDELDIVTTWMMGTWTFSPSCTNPVVYPYLYITGARGSGKSELGQAIAGDICRNHQSTVGATGASLFRMIGDYDPETGDVIAHHPTLSCDEIDATFSGAKDESLRLILNAGYKRGSTVPRAAGKTTINFPVHCPKLLMGIDNGHLPETIVDRTIRIEMKRANPEQLATIEPRFFWDVEDEAAELSESLSQWAKEISLVLREYRPEPIPDLQPRQWEIARALVQLAHSNGNETRIREALHNVMTRNPERPDAKVTLYKSIFGLFSETGLDRVTTNQILERLATDGVSVPGNSGKGLASVLSEDGITPGYIRFPKGHPAVNEDTPVQRGYFRHPFDGAFMRYLDDES